MDSEIHADCSSPPAPQGGRSKKRWRVLRVAAGVAAGGLFLFLSLRRVSLPELWACLLSVDLRYAPATLLVLAAFFWTKALRWSWLLRPVVRLSARELLPTTVIGVAGNNILPARLGEALRLLAISREFRLSKAAVLSTLVLERTLDFIAIIASFALAMQLVPGFGGLERLRLGAFAIGIVCVLALLFFFGCVHRPHLCLRVTARLLSPLPQGIQRKLQEAAGLGIVGLSSLRSVKMLLALLSLSAVHWTLNALCLYFPAIAVASDHQVPFVAAFVLNGIVALGVTLPTAPGQIGTLQLCFVVALAPFAVKQETAVTASIYASLLGFVPVTLTGLFLLLRVRRRSPATSHQRLGPGQAMRLTAPGFPTC